MVQRVLKNRTRLSSTACYWGSRNVSSAGLASVLPLPPSSPSGHVRPAPLRNTLCWKPHVVTSSRKKAPTGLLLHTCWAGRDPCP